VELTEPLALSALIGTPVWDRGGRRLGRVYEICAKQDRGGFHVEGFLVGRHGLRLRLRGPGPDAASIPWEAIVELGADRIVVAM
jgi:sporulation protein YlmC with PRC-barrel domain